MTPAQLISKKRDGEELSEAAIAKFIRDYMSDNVADYQMSAFAMAVCFQGMTNAETVALTRALLESGTQLHWNDPTPKVDKHSTGGLGDKVSLVLAPLLASCGVQVPMISGRGLGITGGTLDKLESISGFRTDLSLAEFQRQTQKIGCVISGATLDLAPADRRLYALRDVTGTVPSQPLIISSILSKKLAENLDSLVLDVKCGSGAFMKKTEQASSLARQLTEVGSKLGVPTKAIVTDMNQPLGFAVGNAIEVEESVAALRGEGPEDLAELTVALGSELLHSVGLVDSIVEGRGKLHDLLQTGHALEKFEQMVAAQSGRIADFELANETVINSPRKGFVESIDCHFVGGFVVSLGGGRRKLSDEIDHRVGVRLETKIGSDVEAGQPLARVYSTSDFDQAEFLGAFSIVDEEVPKSELILGRM